MKRIRAMTAVLLAATLFIALPRSTEAQAYIVQDSCDTSGAQPTGFFSIVNPVGAAAPVCRMTLVPQSAQCFLLECGPPADWQCFVGDVTTFFEALPLPGACVSPGETRGGFTARLLSPYCCFGVALWGADGTVLGTQQFCFDCATVGAERQTWGAWKQRFLE